MTPGWWLFTAAVVLAVVLVEWLVPASYVWIDGILRAGLLLTAAVIIMRRVREAD